MKVLIIGGGLSGICIGHQLEDNNIDFTILDRGKNHSTIIAAGMINPMTFRRLVKTWRGDEFIPFIEKYYPNIEKKIGHSFFFPTRIRRVHSSTDEVKFWQERLNDADFAKYIHPQESPENTPSYINNTFGNAFVNTPGYLDSERFMNYNHQYFKEKGKLINSIFDFSLLDVEKMKYKDESYTHFVFAEGYEGEDNPFFSYLPFKNAKGEVLTIVSDELRTDEIINRKCFVLPMKDGSFKLGSTYSWGTKDFSPTEAGKQELIENYNNLSTAKIKIIKHEGGIRPTAADRRPMIGEHPKHKGIYIFNGLGAKGFTYAPYFATHFVEYLKNEVELDKEVDIQRFYTKFYLENK